MSWLRFNSQFAETPWERQTRQADARAKRRAEGKCWQCGELFVDCACPNGTHASPNPLPKDQ